MKLTFEGMTIREIVHQMEATILTISLKKTSTPAVVAAVPQVVEKPVQKPVDKPVVKTYAQSLREDHLDRAPIEKPVDKKERTEKQKANDARLRERAKENPFGRNTVKVAAPVQPEMPMPPPPKTAEGMDPAEVARNRLRTIEDLQQAYANGHQKEVFELLSRFGNGAKSFRELPPESFVPIREAIDNGGLT